MNLAQRLAAVQADPRFDGHDNPVYAAAAMLFCPDATPDQAGQLAAELFETPDLPLIRACAEIEQEAR